MEQNNKRGTELGKLKFLLGNWISEGKIKDETSGKILDIKGTDSYEWVLGDFFFMHRANVLIGRNRTEVVEMIGDYNAQTMCYQMYSFDNHGNVMQMSAGIKGDGLLVIEGDMMRATLKVSLDGNHMAACWEKTEDGLHWVHWMDMKFHK
jgi:hypothetical protein